MARSGYLIRKFFLHISKEEQRQRFLKRLEEPEKRWKFAIADVKERERWNDYMRAYEDMIRHTSAPHAPWVVVPADRKWYARCVVAAAIVDALERLKLEFPKIDGGKRRELARVRAALEAEGRRRPSMSRPERSRGTSLRAPQRERVGALSCRGARMREAAGARGWAPAPRGGSAPPPRKSACAPPRKTNLQAPPSARVGGPPRREKRPPPARGSKPRPAPQRGRVGAPAPEKIVIARRNLCARARPERRHTMRIH